MAKISPMMQHYLTTKESYKDAILFYRLGDFYEMFFDDALTCSKVLEITLTGKDCGLEERAPMCGVPHHAAQGYIAKLIEAGYKVAVCEQTSEPTGKGLVSREVVRVITPGTIMDNIEEKKNNFLASVFASKNNFGVVYVDISTGELNLLESKTLKELEDALNRIRPAEIICNQEMKELESLIPSSKLGFIPKFSTYENWSFGFSRAEKLAKKHFGVNSLSVFDAEDKKYGISALGALLEYLQETQKRTLLNINQIKVEKDSNFMHLDSIARKNLELVESMNTRKRKGSILWLLDKTKTSMGGRKLRQFVEQPLVNDKLINSRLEAVEELTEKTILLEMLGESLSKTSDIERIVGKLFYGTLTPRDCLALASSLEIVPEIKKSLKLCSSDLLKESFDNLLDLTEVKTLISNSINPNAPLLLKDGGYIKNGYNSELDALRSASTLGKEWLASLEQKERLETGIKNLKIGFNKVFGYYIEVTSSGLAQVPYRYIRKQTTTNSERYITEELKDLEVKILGSEESSLKLENKLFTEIKEFLQNYVSQLQQVASAIAIVDSISSFATVAIENNFTKPVIGKKVDSINIIDGRHPIVESLLKESQFVPNDTLLDADENKTMIITGPNMSGKSTYMRQVAVITLLAHMGSFVPAKTAEISIVDRIFTRIGASDDLSYGQSTFMVEMTEVANILNNATKNSLLILDEIGRGTSTYDGLSIAWAVMEYLSKHLGAKTLFSTHYHELTELEGKLSGVKNYRIMIKETPNNVIFLHKIARGSANKSFGIEVASLAGLPKELTDRAREILYIQESNDTKSNSAKFDESFLSDSKIKKNININEVVSILSEMDMNTISPLMAFGTLQNLVDKVKK